MSVKSERFEMRLDKDTLANIDIWRAKQRDFPSRAEAVRVLVEYALKHFDSEEQLTLGDRLIIDMLCNIAQNRKDDIDVDFIRSALCHGHSWAFKYKYPGLINSCEDSIEDVELVFSILEMWSRIERSYDQLSDEEKAKLSEIGISDNYVKFKGFCGNYETKYFSIMNFIIKDLERFDNYKDYYLNTHTPKLKSYSVMLERYRSYQMTNSGEYLLSSRIIVDLFRDVDNESWIQK